MGDSIIDSLRHLTRLAEAAHAAQDSDAARAVLAAFEVLAREQLPIDVAPVLAYVQALVSRCDHCYMVTDEDEIAALREQVIRVLARHSTSLITAKDKKALRLGPMVRLVTAHYIRQQGDMTEGRSVALVIDRAGAVSFPRRGPLVAELQDYCAKYSPPPDRFEHWLPESLGGYRLMAGSVQEYLVLPEEIPAMSF